MAFYPAGGSISTGAQQPWQFRPESYGALGNGQVTADVTTNGTTTYTSPTIAADPAAVGKVIMIHGANGGTSGPVTATITGANPGANQFTANVAATASVANCPAAWGSNDVTALAKWAAALGTYGTANQFFAEGLLGAKIYMCFGSLQQIGDGSTVPTFNTQIPLPYPNPNGTTPKLVIKLTGAGDMGPIQYWMQTKPMIGGTAIVSDQVGPTTPNATFGQQSVIGGPTGPAGFSSNLGTAFANVKVTVEGVSIWLPIYTSTIAWDFIGISQARAEKSSAMIFAPTGVNNAVQVQPYLNNISAANLLNSISVGWRFPINQNNLDIAMDNCTAEGYETGFRIWDHFAAGRLNCIYCDLALNVNKGGGIGHRISIQNMAAEAYNGGLRTDGTGPQTTAIDIHWVAECASVSYDIFDTGNYLRGTFYFQDPADSARGITVNGGGNLKIVNDQLGPGHMASPPSVPASGTPLTNVQRDATIKLTTGVGVTVSAISIDGTSLGLSMAASSTLVIPMLLSFNKAITLTYAGGTPTWDWWLN